MFHNIEINRLRGIKHSKIEGFKQINLFFGKNNCGKSSLLDAIGFHYSVMKGVWRAIVSVAKKNNVQIFATTHDLDSIKGLRDAAKSGEEYDDSIVCFKLQRTADYELKSYTYSLDSVDYSLTQEIEIR